MDAKELFTYALGQASGVVGAVKPEHLHNATPCTDWDMRQLLSHMLYELSWVADLVAGKTIAQVGDKYDGDLLGDDYTSNWKQAADKAMDAVKKADMRTPVHVSYGDVAASDYLKEMGRELLIHAWDVGQGQCCTLWFEPQVAKTVYAEIVPHAEGLAKSGLFAPAVPVADDAGDQTKLIAIFGRTPLGT